MCRDRLLSLFVATLLVLPLAAQVAPLINGSFESGTTGVFGWTTNAAVFAVHGGSAPFADSGYPIDGLHWLMIGAHGTQGAQAPTQPGGFGVPPLGAAMVTTFFQLQGDMTRLEFDVSFLSDESFNSQYVDFVSVDISDGTLWRNLAYLDVTTPHAGAPSVIYSRTFGGPLPATAHVAVSIDLPSVFANLNTATVLELRISVGNGLDGSAPSRAYVDFFRLTTGTNLPPASGATLHFTANSAGDILLESFTTEVFAPLRHLFSLTPAGGPGSGPFLGLWPDALTYGSIFQNPGIHPFHVSTNGLGRYSFLIPGTFVSGLTVDAVAVVFTPSGTISFSGVTRGSF